MDISRAIKGMLAVSGNTASGVSTALDHGTSWLGSALHKASNGGGGMSTRTVAAVAAACGYRLALVPESQPLPPDSIAID